MMAHLHTLILLLLLAFSGCRTSGSSRSDLSAMKDISSTPSPVIKTQAARVTVPVKRKPDTNIKKVSLNFTESDKSKTPTESPHFARQSQSLSVYDSISLALEGNPDLVALRETEQVGVATVGVAETYPFNPMVQVQVTPSQENRKIPNRGPGTTSHYVLLMQRIQLAHQQQYREDAAHSSLNGVRWNIHQAELQTTALTAQLYFTALYQRGLLEIAEASQSNNERLLESLIKRFEAGDISGADLATVRIDTRSTNQQLRLAEANYQTALRNLRRQLGLPPDSPEEIEGDLRMIRWLLPTAGNEGSMTSGMGLQSLDVPNDNQAWMASWAASRPDVLVAHANIDVASANLNLATADRVPDLTMGPYYQQDPDGLARFGLRAELNLPIINTGRPLETQRMTELNQRTALWRQTLLKAELEAQAAFERYKLAFDVLAKEKTYSISELPQELQSLEKQFLAGEVDVVRIIQARTSILQNQRAQLNLFNELAQSAALLVGATGMPLDLLMGQ
ncbi:TolC family protein [Gimesia algae]|uniref:Outer membrane efflux protein n=1 Tax=Gimesia algae TaxID=2527971 RepID=A0A517VEU4_9PLAN|nr:TolC family protein [Gimesia algae]QDT91497.1 Outer membrane efflux protein [Gimesia algae]